MPQNEINVTETLMEINERLARVETKMDNLNSADDKAERALQISQDNTRDISNLKTVIYWEIAVIVTGVVVPLGIYVLEKIF
ncbi:hemolysin XhlA family protein [Lentilactobacillus diolivorans]|uniref:hemolysin XhlA family protein n=1 Tax=Lentilactobacillus diolivorans TaxID=179838 RepID=UPI002469AD0A|nr:hemolysin XhlA family protein [Lentilactobacillus diolivorans]MDH5105992.1 hemolysin XhlA family protein [Lentilactobacillus diolivorans]